MTSLMSRVVGSVVVSGVVVVGVAVPAGADPADDGQWYIGPYHINEFHAEGIDGSGVTIAVIDEAIYTGLPTLAGADIEVYPDRLCLSNGSRVSGVSDVPAESTHGTNVVANIVGNGTGVGGQKGITGVAPGSKILFYSLGPIEEETDCESIWGDTNTNRAEDAALGFAIDDAVSKGADIVSMSFLGMGGSKTEDALVKALFHGVVIVATVDNPAGFGDSEPVIYNGVLGVGSFGPNSTLMTDSTGSRTHTSDYVDVLAPGIDMLVQGSQSDWTYQSLVSGNSIATPIAAGNIALAMQKYPEATSNQILQSLIHNTGATPHALGWDDEAGYGFVDTISLLDADPTQYPDVNPLLVEEDGENIVSPTIEDVAAGCIIEYSDPKNCPGVLPTPSTSPDATLTPSATPGANTPPTGGTSTLPLILAIALGTVLVGTTIILIVNAKKRGSTKEKGGSDA